MKSDLPVMRSELLSKLAYIAGLQIQASLAPARAERMEEL
jgi:hypothetical protein